MRHTRDMEHLPGHICHVSGYNYYGDLLTVLSRNDLLDSADDAPAIRLINGLIAQGLREGASDIHIEPYEQARSCV